MSSGLLSNPAPPSASSLELMARFIDLSHPIDDGMITYPGLPGPEISEYLSRAESRGHYESGTEFHIGRINLVANTGTYLDTPFHRFPDGYDIADLALESVANLEGICIAVEDPEITPASLPGIDATGRAVLFATGWDRHWGTDSYGDPNHPFISEATAEGLISAGAALVGIDSVNIDDTRGQARPAHSLLLEAGIPIVEHLTGVESLVGKAFKFFAVPAPIRGLGTFPVRAFALVD